MTSNAAFLPVVALWQPMRFVCDAWFPPQEPNGPGMESTCRKTIRAAGRLMENWGEVLRTGPMMGAVVSTGVYRYAGAGWINSIEASLEPLAPLILSGIIADLWGRLLVNMSYIRI